MRPDTERRSRRVNSEQSMNVTAPTCPVCAMPSRFAARHPEADLYRCPACDHCFSDPGSISDPEAYGREYFEESHEKWFNNPNIALFEAIRRRIAQVKSNASVLDLGCGRADLLRYLRRREPRVSLCGVDLTPNDPVEGIRLVQDDLFATRFEQRFDVVTSLAVIEHVPNVHAFVQRLHELCRPGGLVIISTVNDQGVFYRTARVMRRFRMATAFNRLYSKHHLNHFNVSSLRRLVELHGLTVRETIRHNSPLAAVDVPPASRFKTAVFRFGIWSLFLLGWLTGQTLFQTIVCERSEGPGSKEKVRGTSSG